MSRIKVSKGYRPTQEVENKEFKLDEVKLFDIRSAPVDTDKQTPSFDEPVSNVFGNQGETPEINFDLQRLLNEHLNMENDTNKEDKYRR